MRYGEVIQQALADANGGDLEALAWLQVVAPDLVESLRPSPQQPHRWATIKRKRVAVMKIDLGKLKNAMVAHLLAWFFSPKEMCPSI